MKNGYNPINFELYKGVPAKVFSEKNEQLDKSRMIRMLKLDLKTSNDYDIINGRDRKRPKIPSELMNRLEDSLII